MPINPYTEEILSLRDESKGEILTPEEVARTQLRIPNPDTTVSTERSITIGVPGGFVNIPTVREGRQLSDDDATSFFQKSGEKRNVFATQQNAVRAAQERSDAIGREIDLLNQISNRSPNPFENEIRQENVPNRTELESNLKFAERFDPDSHAKSMSLATQHGLSVPVVRRNREALERRGPDLNLDELINSTPKLGIFLRDPNNAVIARDDLDALAKIAKRVDLAKLDKGNVHTRTWDFYLKRKDPEGTRAVKSGLVRLKVSMHDVAAAYGLINPEDAAIGRTAAHKRFQELQAAKSELQQEFDRVVQREGGDVTKAARLFLGNFKNLSRGQILKFVKGYYLTGALTLGESLDAIYETMLKRPRGTAIFVAEQIGNSLPIIAGSIIGALGGGAVGAAPGAAIGAGLGAFSTGAIVEIGAEISQELQERGIDLNDSDAVAAAYRDQDFMNEIKRRAERKGITTAFVDGMLQATGVGILARAKRGVGVVSKAKRFTSGVAIESVGEAAGEAAGQFAREKGDLSKVNFGEALFEGIAGLVQSGGQAAVTESIGGIQPQRERLNQISEQVRDRFAIEQNEPGELGTFFTIRDTKTGDVLLDPDTLGEGQTPTALNFTSKEEAQRVLNEEVENHARDVLETEQQLLDLIRNKYSENPIKAVEDISTDTQKALQAHQDAQTLSEMQDGVEEAKLTKRLPDKLRELVEIAGGDDRSNVFFQTDDWDAFWSEQGKSPAEAAEQILGETTTYQEAKANGTAFEIPIEIYVSKVMVDKEVANSLLPIAKVGDPEGMSLNEAKQHNEALPILMAQIGQETVEQEQELLADLQSEAIGGTMATQLEDSGVSPEGSIIIEKFIRARSIRNGANPNELFKTFPISFVRKGGVPGAPISFEQEGFPLFQEAGEPRGRIDILSDQALVTISESADPSTFFHETGHWFLEFQRRLINSGTASAQETEDFQSILNWFSEQDHKKALSELERIARKQDNELLKRAAQFARKNGGAKFMAEVARTLGQNVEDSDLRGALMTPYHELWARGVEQYILEGKAPSVSLRRAFAQFKQWMIAVYNRVRQTGVELNPTIRGVLDRLLATDAEIAEANNEIEGEILTAQMLGLTGEAAERYNEALKDAQIQSEENLLAKLQKEEQRKRTKAWKAERERVKERVTADAMLQPDQIMLSVIRTGRMPDGTEINDGPLKLSKGAIVELMGKDFLKELPRPVIYTTDLENSHHPENIKDIAGYTSGSEMLEALAVSQPFDQLVDQLTDARMIARNGDMRLDGRISDEAIKSLHVNKRTQLLRKQFELMARDQLPAVKDAIKKIASPLRSDKALREHAEAIISKKTVSSIRPNIYLQAEKRAAKDSLALFLRGDALEASKAKQRQLLNHELYKAAVEAKIKIDRDVKFLNKFQKKEVRAELGKAGQSFVEQVDALLIRADLRKGVTLKELNRRQNLREWVASQTEATGFAPPIPENVLDEAQRKSFKEMTFAELTELRDSVFMINHLASLKNKMLTIQAKRSFDETVEQSTDTMEKNAKRVIEQPIETQTPQEKTRRAVRGFLAMQRKYKEFISEMEGFEDGFLQETFVQKLNDAADAQNTMQVAAHDEFRKIYKVYSKKERAIMSRKKIFVPSLNRSMTKAGLLALALNQGAPDNKQKFREGYGWTQSQVDAVIANKDLLDERDWKFVQSVWDFLDTFWAESKALSERVDGLAPKKVQAAEVITPFGVFKGGYYRLKFDPEQSSRARKNEIKDLLDAGKRGAAVRATTEHGSRIERTESIGLKVRLDLGVMFEHVSEVIHDQTHYETLLDVNKLLGDKRIESTIKRHYGNATYNELIMTIEDIALGDRAVNNTMQKSLNWVRNGTTIAFLGWSVSTIAQQPLGIFPAMQKVGGKWIAKGTGKMLGSPERMQATLEWIYANSQFMKNRGVNLSREISDVAKTLKPGIIPENVQDSYFYFLVKVQLMTADMPTWLGAYEKQMDKDPTNEKRAFQLADQAVRDTQGSGQVIDLARIQRGSAGLKLFTNFMSYFNLMLQRNIEAVKRTEFKDPVSIGRLGVDMMLINIIPATLGLLIREGLRGELDLDDEELGKKLLAENASYLLGQWLLLREFTGAVQGFHGYSGPAGLRFFAEGSGLIRQALEGELDIALLKALNRTGGILFQYPALQIERFVRGLNAIIEGETSNPIELLGGPPRRR